MIVESMILRVTSEDPKPGQKGIKERKERKKRKGKEKRKKKTRKRLLEQD